MKGSRAWSMITGLGVLALLVRIGLELPALGRAFRPQVAHAVPVVDAPVVKGTVVAELPCFECHNHKRFENGQKFSHAEHSSLVGHCHKCHTFEGHMQVGIRKATCTECHEDGSGG